MKIEEFIQSIEGDYLYLLYRKFNNIFPGCCHEASNILCGFIQLYYDASFVHKYVADVPYPHSYISNNNGIIIDFTSFQYLHYRVNNNVTKEELLNIARECKCFPLSSELYIGNYISENYINTHRQVEEIPCIFASDIKSITDKYSKNDFISYCEECAEYVGTLVSDYLQKNF